MSEMGLAGRTEAQRDEHIKLLAKRPIRELWKLQASVQAQQRVTDTQYIQAKTAPEANLLKQALTELFIMEQDIGEALDRK
jgi:hypothetical protein